MQREWDEAHILTGPLLGLLVNFRCPPPSFNIFNAPPESGIQGAQSGILSYRRYNLQFLKMSDILKHVLLVPRQYRLAASITSLSPDEMAPSLKSRFRLTPRGEIINRLLWSIIQRSRSLEHVHVVAGIFWIRVMCSRVPTLENLGTKFLT